MDLSPETLRRHFHALSKKRGAVDKKLDPLRAELGDLVAGKTKLSVSSAQKREAEVREKIVKLQRDLAPIENERATVARALGGQTGIPESEAG